MTAEIAILNRVGVALAADSAVTISSNHGDPKTYDSADKLFQLDGGEPVGIMIHGSAEFMGIPAETIIKGFCVSQYNTPQPELAGYARQFFEFMRHELPIERSTMISRLAGIAVDALVGIRSEAEHDYEAHVARPGARRSRPGVFMARRIQEIVVNRLRIVRRAEAIDGLSDADLPLELEEIVREAVSTVLGDGMLSKIDPISELVRLMLLRQVPVGGEIGFVFAGFGTEQMFPAIHSAECDLSFVNALRVRPRGEAEISSEQVAVISPFAQSEMVERFMDGVDTSYNRFARAALSGAMTRFGNEVAARFGAEANVKAKTIGKELEALRNDFLDEWDEAALRFRKSAYRQMILEVVQFMPKSELSEMAESLVNLTSIKRRVSAEHESVGGPIDVAFVSKYDGFTWIRRKGLLAPRPARVGGADGGGKWS